MIRNSLFISATALILLLFGLMSRLDFLAASKKALFLHCGGSMAVFFGVLGVNLFAAALAINRKILLKDTGRKLSHFDNQLQAGNPEGLPPFLAGSR
ncbi:MAG: hypothetical protein ACRD4S_05340 [Candidatus Acidiferrales bacterium]